MQSAGSRGGRGAPSKGRGSPEGPGLHTEGVDGRASWGDAHLGVGGHSDACVFLHILKPPRVPLAFVAIH